MAYVRFLVNSILAPTRAFSALVPRSGLLVLVGLLSVQAVAQAACLLVPTPAARAAQEAAAVEAGSVDPAHDAAERRIARAKQRTTFKLETDLTRVSVTLVASWLGGLLVLRRRPSVASIIAAITVAEAVSAVIFFIDLGMSFSSFELLTRDLTIGGVLRTDWPFLAPLGAIPLVTLWWAISGGSALAVAYNRPLQVVVPYVVGITVSCLVFLNVRHILHL